MSEMNVVLLNGGINDGMIQRYIGPYKISHYIKKHGYTSQVIDFCDRLTEDQLRTLLQKFVTSETLCIGISTTFLASSNFNRIDNDFINEYTGYGLPKKIYKLCKEFKSRYPSLKVVVGGWVSETLPSFNVIDATVTSYYGNTEDVFLEYLNHLKSKSPPPLGKISSILNKNKVRIWYDTARTSHYNIQDDDFKFTDQDCIIPGESLPLDVSRGCIFACKFCSFLQIGKKKYDYVRKLNLLSDELINNYEKWGVTNYSILDDTFNDTVQKLKEFNSITENLKFKINYSAYIRADLVHRFPESCELLENSGLSAAIFGIETLHPEASKLVGKAWSGTTAREFLPKLQHNIWKNKIFTQSNFITGLPKDTVENIINTTAWLQEQNMCHARFSSLFVMPPIKGDISQYQSEFSRNYADYGIEHIYENDIYVGWKHGDWDQKKAVKLNADIINNVLVNFLKPSAWFIPSLMSYGFSREHIITTPKIKYDQQFILNKTQIILDYYYNKLLEI
jgi:radical SAM superfamily enzyme YgiQ (UPF0313 family)